MNFMTAHRKEAAKMTIYLCEDNFENIMTAVYDAWASGFGHAMVRLEISREVTFTLFTEYITVITDEEKADKVIRSVRKKLSEEVFAYIYKASLSHEAEKADMIYRFLVQAFKSGANVIEQLANDTVRKLYELVRNVENENHLLLGFTRFKELNDGILVANIEPKNRLLTLLAPHFQDRLNMEYWVIVDSTHHEAAVHLSSREWYLTAIEPQDIKKLKNTIREDAYEDLWKAFFHTIAIKERENSKLQKQLMRIRFRSNMLEFVDLEDDKMESSSTL